jgi:hypothetical protein
VLIARYCAAVKPVAWRQPIGAQRRLQRFVRWRSSLIAMLTQEGTKST